MSRLIEREEVRILNGNRESVAKQYEDLLRECAAAESLNYKDSPGMLREVGSLVPFNVDGALVTVLVSCESLIVDLNGLAPFRLIVRVKNYGQCVHERQLSAIRLIDVVGIACLELGVEIQNAPRFQVLDYYPDSSDGHVLEVEVI